MKPSEHHCEWCSIPLPKPRAGNRRRFCNKTCQRRRAAELRTVPVKTGKPCAWCGRPCPVVEVGRPRRFCCPAHGAQFAAMVRKCERLGVRPTEPVWGFR